METKNKTESTNDNANNSELKFMLKFKEDGESFKNIMEKILINKINKNT